MGCGNTLVLVRANLSIIKSMTPPNFDGIYGMTANPLRQVFMMGTIWCLSNYIQNSHLNILEIGSWSGASALTWGEALEIHNGGKGSLSCIDAWEPYYNSDEIHDDLSREINDALSDNEPYNVFMENMEYLPSSVNLTVHRGWSSDVLPLLKHHNFDLIYIDGDHSYQGVSADIEASCALVKDGGIICGDDLELQAHQVDASIAINRPYLDKFIDEVSETVFHPGVTLAVGNKFGPVSSWYGFWAMQKNDGRWEKVSLEGMPPHIPSTISAENLIGLKALLMETGIF
jgi:predicted O-methyltransferase YrrM|tara:strand:- start:136 stop:996 length:861 start_codon:yes stop_codon:yes gene_type:complete